MKSRIPLVFRRSALLCIAVAVSAPSSTRAGDFTWDGSTSGSWIIGTNWVGVATDGAPTMGIGSTQTFYDTGALNLATFLGGGRVLGTLNFNGTADNDVSVRFASLIASGVARDLTLDVSVGSAAINIASDATANITLGGSDGLGSLLLNDSVVITHNGSGNLLINRPISDGSTSSGVIKSGSGALTLSNINNFSGGLTLNAGTLNINNLYALGGTTGTPGAVIINGGTIDNTSGAGITLSAKPNPFTINGDFAFGGSNNLNLGAGAVSLGTAAGTSRTVTISLRTLTIGGVISDGTTAKSLIKDGAGTMTFTNDNNYTGDTSINAGTLTLSGNGSIDASPNIIVGASTTFNVSAVTGGYTLAANQTLSGTGSVVGAASIAGTLSPGNSPGTLTVGSQTWLNGGDYNWQILDAIGTGGTGFDTLSITGTLNLSSLTAGGFSINLWSLASTGPDENGNALNFDNSLDYSWNILTASGGISDFETSDFIINSAATNGTHGFTNSLNGGSFSLGTSGNNLVLSYTAVPEPGAALLGGLGMLALLRRRR